jgi:hypothetical protein
MRQRLRILVPAALVALCLTASAPAALPSLAGLTTGPALYPAYAPSVHDYVVRCRPGVPVRVSASLGVAGEVQIDGVSRTSAAIPLQPGQAFTVQAGLDGYHVRCLPTDFPQWTDSRIGATHSWYVATPSLSFDTHVAHYVIVFDGHGVPVWWYRTPKREPIDAKVLPGPTGPTIAYSSYPVDSHAAYFIRTLDGKLVRRLTQPGWLIDDHDLQSLPNGDLGYLVYRPKQNVDLSLLGGPTDATVLEAEIDIQSPTGKIVWSWTSDGRIALDESIRWAKAIVGAPVPLPNGEKGYDVFHANSISFAGDTVLLSDRQDDAVYDIDRATGDILWKLGGTPTPQSLTVVDDPRAVPLGGQHDARFLPDGTISIFDDASLQGLPPRVVRFRIDPIARTATFVQQIVDPSVTSPICCGSARLLGSGNWLISWGNNPVMGEYEQDGTPVFRFTWDDLFSYRFVPVTGVRLTAAQLRAGMDAMAPRANARR